MNRNERRTLVLNASYEPMAVISSRRARLLALNEKASVLVESDGIVHSAAGTFAEPEVVLLRQFVRAPRRFVPMTRRAVLEMNDYTRAYCFKHGNTIDHVISRARGGMNTWGNVVFTCTRCNCKKADRLISELGWKLPFELREPTQSMATLISKRWKEPTRAEYTDPWAKAPVQLELAG